MTELTYSTATYRRALYHQNKRQGTNTPLHPLAQAPASAPSRQFLPSGQFLLEAMKAPPPPAPQLSAVDRRAQFLARNREEQARQRKV